MVSTMKLVDTTDEQELLEDILESSKPPVPVAARGHGFLLSTPFRYRSRHDSRFRTAASSFGVFYAAEDSRTAVHEMIFYRLLFFAESPETKFPSDAKQYSLFSVSIACERSLDLTQHPLSADHDRWVDRANYSACQAVANLGQGEGLQLIRYQSVREPSGTGRNLALMDPSCFVGTPQQVETWNIFLGPGGAQAIREMPRTRFDCPVELFLDDPRLRALAHKFKPTTDSGA
ncbi:RES family NAD+ phosphorylase [Paracoccus beibuensis]|uniref:RES family NAD+ phosphorylase n=1 Tax=Paracoccus beibuensis TaxID=547602 RepID=UPI002AD32C33|nr:RES family NAD+ phosphorylase [Paracoccus beibuensis]